MDYTWYQLRNEDDNEPDLDYLKAEEDNECTLIITNRNIGKRHGLIKPDQAGQFWKFEAIDNIEDDEFSREYMTVREINKIISKKGPATGLEEIYSYITQSYRENYPSDSSEGGWGS